jgi:uncharacterized protein DUF4255
MLDVALKFLASELNSYLLSRTGSEFGKVEVGRLVDDTGKWAGQEDHLGAALVNVEEERTLKPQLPEKALVNGNLVTLEPALRLNLHVLFAAHFQHYDQALRYLSHVLTFFQAHPSFNQDRYPDLDPRIRKLTAELLALNYEQLNQLWAYIGGKHLPSAVYKFRLVSLQDVEPSAVQPPITSIDAVVHSR